MCDSASQVRSLQDQQIYILFYIIKEQASNRKQPDLKNLKISWSQIVCFVQIK